jgi:hypothetical protein
MQKRRQLTSTCHAKPILACRQVLVANRNDDQGFLRALPPGERVLRRQHGTLLYDLPEMGGWKSAEMVRRYAHLAPAQMARNAP